MYSKDDALLCHRPSAFVPVIPPKKGSYSTLLTSPPDPIHKAEDVAAEDKESGDFKWKHLGMDAAPSADEASEKGHSRSTSLDLNKILLGHSAAGDGELNLG